MGGDFAAAAAIGTSTTAAVAATHTTTTTTTASVLHVRNLERCLLLAVAVASATVPVIQPTQLQFTPAAARTVRLRKLSMKNAMDVPDSVTRNYTMTIHRMTLRNTPSLQT